MENDLIKITYKQERVGIKTFKTKYIAEVKHTKLNDYKVFTSFDKSILQSMVDTHVLKIEEKWDVLKNKRETQSEAFIRTIEAKKILSQIDNILLDALEIENIDYWDFFKDKKKFENKKPIRLTPLLSKPTMPNLKWMPKCPDILVPEQVKLSFLGKFKKNGKFKKQLIKIKNTIVNGSKKVKVLNQKTIK